MFYIFKYSVLEIKCVFLQLQHLGHVRGSAARGGSWPRDWRAQVQIRCVSQLRAAPKDNLGSPSIDIYVALYGSTFFFFLLKI